MHLNFPPFAHQLRKQGQAIMIWDVIRKKYIVLEPEEWVRQHLIHFLIGNGYPKGLIQVEVGHQFNQLQRRTDVTVYTREGNPYLLAECKAPNIPINTAVFEQAIWYNKKINAPYMMLTNGMEHLYYSCHSDGWQQQEHLPVFPD